MSIPTSSKNKQKHHTNPEIPSSPRNNPLLSLLQKKKNKKTCRYNPLHPQDSTLQRLGTRCLKRRGEGSHNTLQRHHKQLEENRACLQPKERRVSLSLDVSNMALPTEDERCPRSDRENMEVGSISSDWRLSLQARLTGTSLAFTIRKKKAEAAVLMAFTLMLPNKTHTPA